MEQNRESQVIIVGAGPAGLTLACDLLRRGVKAHVIDDGSPNTSGSKGKGLQPRTQEVFDDLGILEELLAVGSPYPDLRIHRPEGVEERPFSVQEQSTPDVPYPNLLMVSQWRTEAALLRLLESRGGSVSWGARLIRLEHFDARVEAEVETAEGKVTLKASYLVGADGGRSTVRKQVGVAFPGRDLDHPRILFADVEADGVDANFWHQWSTDNGVVGLCPLPSTTQFQLMIPLADGYSPALTAEGVASAFEKAVPDPQVRVHSPSWMSIYTPRLRVAESFNVGRVFLIGDAAHVHPPMGGQGLNTSVQDAYNLGWKLAGVLAGAGDKLLDTFQIERHRVAQDVLDLAERLSQATVKTGAEAMKRGRDTKQLDLHYRWSPLSVDGDGDEHLPRAGDRAPDATYVTDRGDQRRLFQDLAGPDHTLLSFGRGGSPRPGVKVLNFQAGGSVAQTYHAEDGQSVLVRPDGYIALAPTHDQAQIDQYCNHWLNTDAMSKNAGLAEGQEGDEHADHPVRT